ncbi:MULTISPECIES: bifunctional folylpolyglutamate synthase/dihydrofolate synthase [Heyndrickxia]|uniref:Dihydrofolate synthase/folylpolyglutamate synthase n=4 Tax=Heyndrickxia sporothermodurans TaxID=46224 RepID=A0AB37H9Q4_9BACI|nr:folylpolyglutamate synthase/dihydrofolate synthase family protein [Heyndrickxia sporothermodurans]MBL5766163.1 bifunctional folylpolyglutamate synthase/dihydrofolate synthase [Heyndrickxia sporothermodurans]MBL5769604.1 bifunctional folylpolyglutamate synthase/dihydrofolate synthase [Heyndrickxia sporothermodurans]MBL5773387.1 bifunctional folylpolyglutamate synthase/dihydrofolate synthase [Heyndrickxia sporothermodurans]MBL5776768.1 bifunctional folylpolyglutamate synthase/dihydrofolate syn
MQTYEEAIDWINSRLKFGIKPGLERMEWMMKKLGSPEKKLKVIHIGGTNGKGSTVTYLRSILNEAGYRVGTFTSPYIETFNERISVNGQPITDEEIIQLVNSIQPFVEEIETTNLGSLTEFEVITVMAIYYFAYMNPMDMTIFEVGLGGRLDSTNILQPILSIITNIGMDHVNILGHTVAEIAFEKAGIIKNEIPVITGAKQKEALEVIKNKSKDMNAKLFISKDDFKVENIRTLHRGEQFTFSYSNGQYQNLVINMLGKHQIENAILAIGAAIFLHIDEPMIREGLKKAFWPGRMEVLSEHPFVIVDGAHNPEGINSLINTLQEHFPYKKKKMIFAALSDKELTNMIQPLAKLDAEVYFTEFDFPRAASAEQLFSLHLLPQAKVNKNWKKLLEEMFNALEENEMLIISGSLYFISNVKLFFKEFTQI